MSQSTFAVIGIGVAIVGIFMALLRPEIRTAVGLDEAASTTETRPRTEETEATDPKVSGPPTVDRSAHRAVVALPQDPDPVDPKALQAREASLARDTAARNRPNQLEKGAELRARVAKLEEAAKGCVRAWDTTGECYLNGRLRTRDQLAFDLQRLKAEIERVDAAGAH